MKRFAAVLEKKASLSPYLPFSNPPSPLTPSTPPSRLAFLTAQLPSLASSRRVVPCASRPVLSLAIIAFLASAYHLGRSTSSSWDFSRLTEWDSAAGRSPTNGSSVEGQGGWSFALGWPFGSDAAASAEGPGSAAIPTHRAKKKKPYRPKSSHRKPSTPPHFSSSPLPPSQVRLRRPDFFRGTWQYDPYSTFSHGTCRVSDLPDPTAHLLETPEQRLRRTKERADAVARWVWVPEARWGNLSQEEDGKGRGKRGSAAKEGSRQMPWKRVAKRRGWREWTGYEMWERLLQTEMGILFIGDSLSGQHLKALLYTMSISRTPHNSEDSAPIPFLIPSTEEQERTWSPPTPTLFDPAFPTYTSNTSEVPGASLFSCNERHSRFYFLNPLARDRFFPHVPESRLHKPILTMLRADFLLHVPEVDALLEQESPGEGFKVEARRERHPEAWREWIRMWMGDDTGEDDVIRKRRKAEAGEIEQPERSIVVLNTGAHWTRHGVMGGGSPEEEKRRLLDVFRRVADTTLSFLAPYRSRIHLIYRTTSPGHPGCSDVLGQDVPTEARDPIEAEASAAKAANAGEEATKWSRYGWDRFEAMDDVWRQRLRRLEASEAATAGDRAKQGWKVDVMEVREQALARGDAHSAPDRGDCLHWCMPSIPPMWSKGLGHLILDNFDHDETSWYVDDRAH